MKATTRPITTLKKLLVPWLRRETLCVQQQLPGCFTNHSFMIEWQRESHLCEIQLMFARRHVGDFETKWKSLYGLTKQYATFLTITPNAIISEANTGHHLIIPNMIYGGASLMMWGGGTLKTCKVKLMQESTQQNCKKSFWRGRLILQRDTNPKAKATQN